MSQYSLAGALYFIRRHLMQSKVLLELAEVLAWIDYGDQFPIWAQLRPVSYVLSETKEAA